MKNQRLGLFVIVLVFASLACNLLVPNNPNKIGNAPVVDFITPAEPLNVTVQLDEAFTTSEKFTSKGGVISLTAGDGSVFMLEVPAKALETDTVITMTVIKSITGAPLSAAPVAAVQLEPSGLFFNEFVTLTVTPAQAIPIENQIIFAYEGNGQDYHLAIIDPKSREIKIKLLEFSGAGVGSGGDKEWAANLQHQANDSRVRLQNEVAKLLQPERLAQLLGQEANDQISSTLKSYMEKYYDQVIQKEMVAAELDCKYAEKAIQDLIGLERDNELLSLNGVDSNGEIIPIVDDLSGEIAKLAKIGEKCKKSYSISGVSNEVSYSGEICNLEEPFILNGTFANGTETQSFTPSNATSGTVEESGSSDGCTNSGEGSYIVILNEQGSGELQWTESITSSCPPYSVTNTLTFKLPLNPAPDLFCP